MSDYRRAVVITTISQIVAYSLPLVTFPLMVRTFDINLYGAWIEANTVVVLANALGTQGLGNAVGALIVGRVDDHDSVYSNALYLFLVSGGSLAVLMAAFAPGLNSITIRSSIGVPLIRGVSLLILLYGLNWLGAQVYRLRGQPLRGAVFDVALGLARLGVVLFAFLFTHDLLVFARIAVAVQAAVTVAQLLVAYRGIRLTWPAYRILRQMIRDGVNLTAVSQSNWVVMYGDRLMLSIFATTREVALYSASYQISMILVALGWPHLYALLPVIGERRLANDVPGLQAAVRRSTRWMVIILLPAAMGIALTGESLMRFVATQEFSATGLLVGLIAGGVMLDTLGTNLQYIYYAQNRSAVLRRIFIQVAVFNFAINLIAIPILGSLGAAITTLLTFCLSGFLLAQKVQMPFRNLVDGGVLWRCLVLSGLVAGWVVAVLRTDLWSLILAVAGGAVLYGIGLFALRLVRMDDLRRLLISAFHRQANPG